MAIIKIEEPIYENMDNSLNEQQCDELFAGIKYVVEADSMMGALLEFNDKFRVAPGLSAEIAAGKAPVSATVKLMKTWIKNKYGLTASRILDQSKEINDLYVKINDILTHDKFARFRHRNDVIDCSQKFVRLQLKDNPQTVYQITNDIIAYNIEYFIKEINSIMKYINESSKNKDNDLAMMRANLIKTINDGFEENHWFTEKCEPVIKEEFYRGVKLGRAIKVFESVFSEIYSNISVFNHTIDYELKYVQLIEQAYNRMLSQYGKDKNGKELVDDVFKKLLANMAISMDFNSKLMDLEEEVLHFYAQEIEKIYNIIRS